MLASEILPLEAHKRRTALSKVKKVGKEITRVHDRTSSVTLGTLYPRWRDLSRGFYEFFAFFMEKQEVKVIRAQGHLDAQEFFAVGEEIGHFIVVRLSPDLGKSHAGVVEQDEVNGIHAAKAEDTAPCTFRGKAAAVSSAR